MDLDKKDRLILQALQQDARQSLSALGKRIGLSQPAISERVRRLEEAGVIDGYSARVNLAAVGLRLQAIVRLRTTHEHIRCPRPPPSSEARADAVTRWRIASCENSPHFIE